MRKVRWGHVLSTAALLALACGGRSESGGTKGGMPGGEGGSETISSSGTPGGGSAAIGGSKGTGGSKGSGGKGTGGKGTGTGGAKATGGAAAGGGATGGAKATGGTFTTGGINIGEAGEATFGGEPNSSGGTAAGGASGGMIGFAGEPSAFGGEAGMPSVVDNLKPGSDAIVERDGFRVQCKQWDGNVCIKPWIQIPLSAVEVVPNCADPIDITSLRPVWYGGLDGTEEATTFCWIATGSSQVRSHNVNGPNSTECGWMYGLFNPQVLDCNDFRRYARVNSPGDIPDISWSFDISTGGGCRPGTYSKFECYW